MPTKCPPAPKSTPAAEPQPLWAIVGATASGKSPLALSLAADVGGDIIACDSVQVYRGFDIGSAKASLAERACVPHHLLDVVEADAPFDAQMYCDRVEVVLASCKRRAVQPILCGGTGMYLRALRYGLGPEVPSQPAFRAARMAEEAQTPGALFLALRRCDPSSAERIGPYNLVQLLRALEITVVAQEPASAIRARHKTECRARPMRIMQPVWPADKLRARIQARTKAMLAQGLLDEVRDLLAQGVSADCRPMRAVGYKEACAVVQQRLAEADLLPAIVKSSWAYARRQRTWLRREADVMPLEMRGDATDVARARALLHAAPASDAAQL